jgi:hypothetical protein
VRRLDGFGALNEVEFIAVLFALPNTNVGGYENTGLGFGLEPAGCVGGLWGCD